VVKPKKIREFASRYPDATQPLLVWLEAAEAADWHGIADLREMYPHADAVAVASGNVVAVFNVRGNRYRLITAIKYRYSMVYVLRFLTHGEYDKEKWKVEL
jgi:mRNA interferase HigB